MIKKLRPCCGVPYSESCLPTCYANGTPTPRTEAVLQPYQPTPAFDKPQWVSADFARILERELIDMRKALDELHVVVECATGDKKI